MPTKQELIKQAKDLGLNIKTSSSKANIEFAIRLELNEREFLLRQIPIAPPNPPVKPYQEPLSINKFTYSDYLAKKALKINRVLFNNIINQMNTRKWYTINEFMLYVIRPTPVGRFLSSADIRYRNSGIPSGVGLKPNSAAIYAPIKSKINEFYYHRITIITTRKSFKSDWLREMEYIDSMSYFFDVSILDNFENIPLNNPVPINKERLKQTILQREGLTDHSYNKPPGTCVIDMFTEHTRTYHTKKGFRYEPITREYITQLFLNYSKSTIDEGFCVDDMIYVAQVLNFAGLIVYKGESLHTLVNYNKPQASFIKPSNMLSKRAIPVLSIVVVDGHVYQTATKPGIVQNTSFCILPSFDDKPTSSTVYIDSEENLVNKKFLELVSKRYLPAVHYVDRLNMEVTRMVYNDILYCHSPDVRKCLHIVQLINEAKPHKLVEYMGQSFHTLLLTLAEKKFNVRPSIISPNVYDIFTSAFAKNYGNCGWLCPPEKRKNLKYVDIRKAYQSCMHNFLHISVSPSEDFQRFENDEIVNYYIYFILINDQIKDCLLLHGPGLYSGRIIQQALDDNLISITDIKMFLKTEPSNAKIYDLLEFVNQQYDDPNLDLNKMVGVMQSTSSQKEKKMIYTTNWQDILRIIPEGHHKPEYKLVTIDLKNEEIPKLYCYSSAVIVPKLNTHIISHHVIINLMQLMIYNHIKLIANHNKKHWKDCVAGFYVDSIAFFPDVDLPDFVKQTKQDAKAGDLVHCKPFKTNMSSYVRERYYYELSEDFPQAPPISYERPHERHYELNNTITNIIYDEIRYNKVSIYDFTASIGLFAAAGYGKSYQLGIYVRELLKLSKNIVCLAYTHTAVDNLNKFIGANIGQTVSSFLGINAEGEEMLDRVSKWNKSLDFVIIDEVFLTPAFMMEKIYNNKRQYHTKLILSGDPGQLAPIGEQPAKPYNSFIASMVDNNFLRLEKCWRADGDKDLQTILDKAYKNEIPDLSNCGNIHTDLSIVATNSLKDRINNKKSLEHAPINTPIHPVVKKLLFIGQPITCIKTNGIIKNGSNHHIKYISDTRINDIPADQFNTYFDIRYAITCDKAMCQTFNHPYSIFQINHSLAQRHGWLYVALSRATKLSHINICDENQI